eukprot:CAMPEP_0171295604 /NCGR_PEP_ID=MMETSP0816-20121228/4219_1 /TAXON_ID=420281 /ORGANISM="Proboscia inermis, Strain CCAP1064/1" /LENGTH=107 /DNA_ID=CAMNT_0011768395 /DNA_START=210 /DNA_END=529 /DNA_ORIENTATION=+
MQLRETAVCGGNGGNDGGGGGEAAQQIAYADRILLNKIDLLNPSQHPPQLHSSLLTLTSKPNISTTLEDVQALIPGINPTALCITTQYSRTHNLNQILDAHCFDMER